jgi:putative ABC transport system ATP-binding protein
MCECVIKTAGLRKVYALGAMSVEALRGVDLTVRRGEFLAIMGKSGSGKSTLLSILGCLEQPTDGSYWLAGEEVARFDERTAARVRRERIGFIFQAYNLMPRATALSNVELPLLYAGVSRDERRERAREALASVGLSDRRGHYPNQLSGGQQQRVAIARALATRPDVVLADEPTGNLDSASETEILDLLATVNRGGATLIIVTHAREVAERGSHIVEMLDGLIVGEEVLRGPASVMP